MPSKRRRRTLATTAAAEAAAAAGPQRFDAEYPQLVERLMPTVYVCSLIQLTINPLDLGAAVGGKVFRVLDPEPTAGDALTPLRRLALIDAGKLQSETKGIRVCLVFGPRDSVYLAPGQAPTASTRPPQGGLDVGEVCIRPLTSPTTN